MTNELGVSVTTYPRGVVIHLSGPLGAGAAQRLGEALAAVDERATPAVILDLEQVPACDVQGMGAIIAAMKHAARRDIRLIMAAAGPPVARAVERHGLTERAELRHSVREAVAELEG
ncbi:STAS domain-containing protein [Nonomuraea endophytica]|uniref:Anti-anti-sigma factor n=1 Tax=Nonomuraea endophytica TaxID=714136 RepID=A0A7W8EF55_9ACTN|nr:STAS domain-containing protein [Nonomuraea endophytica]MBB5078400.1 anti-anti-sigma factor [Nonomuraea endophytica]